MVVDFEMAGAHVDTATLEVRVEREELLKDEVAVLEVRVGDFKPELDVHVIVLVVSDAEAISFEHLTVGHAAITKEYLGAFRECIFTSGHSEGVIKWHVIEDLVPDSLCHILTHLNLLLTIFSNLSHFSEFTSFRPHALVPERLLLNKQVKIVITFQTTGAVSTILGKCLLLFLEFLGLLGRLFSLLLLLTLYRHLHQLELDFLVLLLLISLCRVALISHLAPELGL